MFDIGSSLREARTRQGLDFDELETRTKIRAKYLRHLEDERFEQLPGHTYTKGFLRVYADALGLDGRLYVDEYNSRYVGNEDELAPRLPRSSHATRRRQRRESRTVAVALGAILLVTALVIAAWRFGGPDDPKVEGVNSARSVAGAQHSVQTVTLVVRAVKGSSFLQVRARSRFGKPLYTGTLQRGQTQRFTKPGLYYLSVSKPRNVVVKLDGRLMAVTKGGIIVGADVQG